MKVAGLGFRAGAPLDSLRHVLQQAEAQTGRVAALASMPAKVNAPALQALAAERGLPVHAVTVHGMATQTQSPRVKDLYGTGSVAEAAALGHAGPGARLILPRISSADGMATCAVAESKGEAE